MYKIVFIFWITKVNAFFSDAHCKHKATVVFPVRVLNNNLHELYFSIFQNKAPKSYYQKFCHRMEHNTRIFITKLILEKS